MKQIQNNNNIKLKCCAKLSSQTEPKQCQSLPTLPLTTRIIIISSYVDTVKLSAIVIVVIYSNLVTKARVFSAGCDGLSKDALDDLLDATYYQGCARRSTKKKSAAGSASLLPSSL